MAALMHEWSNDVNPNCGCNIPSCETVEHLFLKGEVAQKLWNHYCNGARIIEHRMNLKQSVRLWR